MKHLIVAVLLSCLCFTIYSSPVNVFIIPHSHCDVGWLQTIEGYYENYVKRILDNTVEALMKDPARKFIWVEVAFFIKWWKAATDTQRQQFRYLLTQTRQIEFIIGGIVMNDEALVTYGSIIDQMTAGNTFLLKEFGTHGIPRVGWQIDPFGASSIQAALSKLMDFDYTVTNRIDYITKEQYKKTKHLEFMWQGSRNLGEKSRIFTHVLDSHYSAPYSFDWQRPNESPAITEKNIKSRADSLVKVLRERANWFATNNILVPFGDDFEFTWAESMFGNMTLLINYINARPEYGFNLQFAKLTDYFDTVIKAQAPSAWPVYEGDYQPYADNEHSYWTGYFTSVPSIKEAARRAERQARTSETLFSIARLERNIDRWQSFDDLFKLRIAYGDVMHHDGITGTERPDVTQMYIDDIAEASIGAENVAIKSLTALMQRSVDQAVTFTLGRSLKVLSSVNRDTFAPIVLYNSLGWERREYVTIPLVQLNNFIVRDETGELVPSQIAKSALDNGYEMKFLATLPALGYRTYYVSVGEAQDVRKPTLVNPTEEDIVISNSVYEVQVCQDTGRVCRIKNKQSNVDMPVDHNFMAYHSFSDRAFGQTSGAYIFRPAEDHPFAISDKKPVTQVLRGVEFSQVIQNFTSYASQVIRLYHNDPSFIEVECLIGPLPENREFISRFTTKIANNRDLFVEQNGLELIKKPHLTNTKEPVAANYNAMQYAAFIRDSNAQLTIVSDRSVGVASLANGQIEMMLHRRCSQDDGRGLGVALNDQTVIRPRLRLVLDTPSASAEHRHKNSYLLNFPVEVFAAQTAPISDYRNFTRAYRTFYSPMSSELPPNMHLLTLQAYDKDSTYNTVRLVNIYENDETSSLARYNETVSVSKLFTKYNIVQWMDANLSTSRIYGKGTGAPSEARLAPINFKTYLLEFEQEE